MESKADAWVREGVITRAQAKAILEREATAPREPADPATRSAKPWLFVAATILPLVFGFLLAGIIVTFNDDLTSGVKRGTHLAFELSTLGLGIVASVLGGLRRDQRHGQLALVAGASLLSGYGFSGSNPDPWAVAVGPLVLLLGLAISQPSAARIANAVLLPLATLGFLGALPIGTDSTILTVTTLAFWLLTFFLLDPAGIARRIVSTGLLVVAGSTVVLGVVFFTLAPTLDRALFALFGGALTAAFVMFRVHPRLKGTMLPTLVA